jgi:CDP-glycerol glycerophosphotransferase
LRMTAVCSVAGRRITVVDAAQRTWRASIETPGRDVDADDVTAVVAAPDCRLSEHEDPAARRELAARVGAGGRLLLADRHARVRVRAARWDRGVLQVRLTLPAWAPTDPDAVSIVLLRADGSIVQPVRIEPTGHDATVRFEVLWPTEARSISPGTWLLRVGVGGTQHDDLLPLEVDEAKVRGAGQAGTDQPIARIIAGPQRLAVQVRSNRMSDAGGHNQHRLETSDYVRARSTPLRDTILFQSWGGKQYSDSPRAIYEELRRQGRDQPMLWVRRDTSVELPPGVPSVLLSSREYYEALGTARYVVANDALPPFYVKRDGSTYLQTWHGTPLKRIGFDIENAQFGNAKYLDEFAVEVTKWDRLISPNAFSTEIFQRAFNYRGEVLETGYPRNDVFYAPDVEQQRAAVRAKLGLHPDQRVVLWAPTWREDQRDSRGRYSLPLPFDLATWDRILQPDDLLLFRGHQLIQATVGGMLHGLRQVRNVTLYPDIQELYLAADLLITDYSSVMFDFANTRRPMIFYAWDLEHYRDRLRGFYFDFESTVPGPVVTDLAGLSEVLADPSVAAPAHAERYARFIERFCALEDGHAAQRVIDAVFGSSG